MTGDRFENVTNDDPQDEGTNEQADCPTDEKCQGLDVQGKAFGMCGSAPYVTQQPKCQTGIEQTCDDTPRRSKKYHAESLPEQPLTDVAVLESQLPVKLNLALTQGEHLYQRILHQQDGGKNDEET